MHKRPTEQINVKLKNIRPWIDELMDTKQINMGDKNMESSSWTFESTTMERGEMSAAR